MMQKVADPGQVLSGDVRPPLTETDPAAPAYPAAAGGGPRPPAVLPPLDAAADGDGFDTLNTIYALFFAAVQALTEAVEQCTQLPHATARVVTPPIADAFQAAVAGGHVVYRAINVRMAAAAAGVHLVAGTVDEIAPAGENADLTPVATLPAGTADPAAGAPPAPQGYDPARRCWHCDRRLGPWGELPVRRLDGVAFRVCRHCRASQFPGAAHRLVKGG